MNCEPRALVDAHGAEMTRNAPFSCHSRGLRPASVSRNVRESLPMCCDGREIISLLGPELGSARDVSHRTVSRTGISNPGVTRGLQCSLFHPDYASSHVSTKIATLEAQRQVSLSGSQRSKRTLENNIQHAWMMEVMLKSIYGRLQ